MKQGAQQLSGRTGIPPRAEASFKARPALSTARGSPRADVAMRKRSGGGGMVKEASWAAGGRFAAKSCLCLCQEDVLVIVSLRVAPQTDSLGWGAMPLGWGPSLGSCPSSARTDPASSRGWAEGRLQTLLVLILWDAGSGSSTDHINPSASPSGTA